LAQAGFEFPAKKHGTELGINRWKLRELVNGTRRIPAGGVGCKTSLSAGSDDSPRRLGTNRRPLGERSTGEFRRSIWPARLRRPSTARIWKNCSRRIRAAASQHKLVKSRTLQKRIEQLDLDSPFILGFDVLAQATAGVGDQPVHPVAQAGLFVLTHNLLALHKKAHGDDEAFQTTRTIEKLAG
jgi:hypothetical protein